MRDLRVHPEPGHPCRPERLPDHLRVRHVLRQPGQLPLQTEERALNTTGYCWTQEDAPSAGALPQPRPVEVDARIPLPRGLDHGGQLLPRRQDEPGLAGRQFEHQRAEGLLEVADLVGVE
ncbi:hypothetical protein AQJ43_28565 [Streptomyces avermitilis]|nr:hypothetical protein AQJ43_28565 [Streptomyces avermitilis]